MDKDTTNWYCECGKPVSSQSFPAHNLVCTAIPKRLSFPAQGAIPEQTYVMSTDGDKFVLLKE